MGYMKRIYTEIKELYPNNLKKRQKLVDDFNAWIKGEYGIPQTDEIRKIILKHEGGK